MLNLIKNIFRPVNNFKIQSFTFYIPSPPERSTGYREKHFDKLFYQFINRGFEIISVNTESSSGTNQSGMWIICLVRALNEEANKLNLYAISEKLEAEPIEGLYYLDNESNEKI
jgi:hypothetical protein